VRLAPPHGADRRNLQTLLELGVDKNTTVVFPSPLMSTIEEIGTFLARGSAAAHDTAPAAGPPVGAAGGPARPSSGTIAFIW
jgi:hypothetical protein